MHDRQTLDFFDDYHSGLDAVELEAWPGFFTEDCLYRVIPRENYEAGYTLCTIQAESRGMLIDRVQPDLPSVERRLTRIVPRHCEAAWPKQPRATWRAFHARLWVATLRSR